MKETINIAEIREKLSGRSGRDYWAALGDMADNPSVRRFLDGPETAGWDKEVTRRQMLKFMSASLALAGLGACTRQPIEKIFPYAEAPERMIPGRPLFFASSLTRQGVARGVMVESHMGRPTKVEGNPNHPDSQGATDVFMQAEILNLYDPDRLQAVMQEGRISTWNAFVSDVKAEAQRLSSKGGEGLFILTETVTSPSEAALLRALLRKFPGARWHQFDPAARDSARAGSLLSFGRAADAIYRFDKAERIFSLDADFLFSQPGSLRYTRDYVSGRNKTGKRNRLYVAESSPTVTGSMADHRFSIRTSAIENVADHLARRLGAGGSAGAGQAPAWLDAAAKDLLAHRGRAVVVPGDFQTPRVHALAQAMNRVLGAVGTTVDYIDPVDAEPIVHMASMKALSEALESGKVEHLLMIGGNPVFSAPGDVNFAELLMKARRRTYLGSHRDETARLCHFAVPRAHELEAWGDAKAFDGTVSFQQPLIAPLYEGKSPLEVLSVWADESPRTGHDVVRDHWRSQWGPAFEERWRKAVHDGVLAGSAHRPLGLQPREAPAAAQRPPAEAFEISIRPDPTIWDGRFANNGWLQELPKPITTLTWDNVAHLSAADAQKLGVENGDVLELEREGRTVRAPAWITPGQAAGAISLTLGYGRSYAGRIGTKAGFRAEALRSTDAPWMAGVNVRKTRKKHDLSITQNHHKMEGRDLIRVQNHGDHGDAHNGDAHGKKEHPSFFPAAPVSERYAWAMAIDLDMCVGCNACTIACQAENNIPIVGKDQVARGREMHWIRIDRYHEGPDGGDALLHQPVPCMHCETAPCEVVCPVAATTHSEEGLNEMTYNRCVGTRYCSNNCPYKVRRFNFYQYADIKTETLKMQRNPDVTVRERGVMEKCTYCVQRINVARTDAEKENRDIRDGEIRTACQQACPASAIVFGNLLDKTSEVSKRREDERHYGLLTELNTKPRTTYLARVRNLNPEIADVG